MFPGVTSRALTVWERGAAARTGTFALAAFGIALLVTAASDEGGVTWANRLGRTLPAAPVLAAAATALVAQRSRARGEWRALASLGASPWSLARGVVAGAAAFALGAALVTATLPGAAAAFFPRAPFAAHFVLASGAVPHAFVDPKSGWTVLADGALVRHAAAGPIDDAAQATVPTGAALFAAIALVAAGAGLSLLVAAALAAPPARTRRSRRSSMAHIGRPVALAALVLLAFQRAAATGHCAAVPAALALLYLVDGAHRFRRLGA